MRLSLFIAVFALIGLLSSIPAAQAGVPIGITFGQIDDFTDGLTAFWSEGTGSPNPPMVVLGGGPGGIADAYLENVSSGDFGAGGRMVMFNFVQWSGDYVTEGVTRIEADMANFGLTALHMRIAFEGGAGQRWGSSTAVELPPDGQWHSIAFDLTEDALDQIAGVGSLADALSNVGLLRILSAAGGAAFIGDRVDAVLGVDNILATAGGVGCDSAAACPNADVNCDDIADGFDIAVVRQGTNWLMATGDAEEPRADVNGDGIVDGFDIATIRSGTCWLQ